MPSVSFRGSGKSVASSAASSTITDNDINKKKKKLPKLEGAPGSVRKQIKKNRGRPRQWIYDRANGIVREEGDSKPPCFCCYPPPYVKCCPWLLEENCICTCIGRIGCCNANDKWIRSAVFKYTCVLNVMGLLLLTYSALSFTENMKLLGLTSWNAAILTAAPEVLGIQPMTLELGLRSVSIDNPNTFGQQVVPFDLFCELEGMETYIQDFESKCNQCQDASYQMVSALVVAIVAFLPNIMTNVIRQYGNFDMNCQKAWATLLSCLTLAGCILTWYQYQYMCLASFYDGPVSYNSKGQVVEAGGSEEVVIMTFAWEIGNGIICFYAGFGMKVIDFVCNTCLVPTPTITRDPEEQSEYERLCLAADEEFVDESGWSDAEDSSEEHDDDDDS